MSAALGVAALLASDALLWLGLAVVLLVVGTLAWWVLKRR